MSFTGVSGELLPDELTWVVAGTDKARVKPGELRECDVKVGRHVAIGDSQTAE